MYDKILACGTDFNFNEFDYDWEVYLDDNEVAYGVNFIFTPQQIYDINPRDLDDAVLIPYIGAEDRPNKSRLMMDNDWEIFRHGEADEHGFFITHRPYIVLDKEFDNYNGWTVSIVCEERKVRFAYAIATKEREDGLVQVSLAGYASKKRQV